MNRRPYNNAPSYVLACNNAPKCVFMQEVNNMRLLYRCAYNDVIITMRLTVIWINWRTPNLHAPKDYCIKGTEMRQLGFKVRRLILLKR